MNGMDRQDVEGTWSGEMAGGRESVHAATVQSIFMMRDYTWSGIVSGEGGQMEGEEREEGRMRKWNSKWGRTDGGREGERREEGGGRQSKRERGRELWM